MKTDYKEIALKIPKILLPNKNVDMQKWAVVACDQFTSQQKYWDDVKSFVGDDPSTLNLVYPEVFLESDDKDERIESIKNCMKQYSDEILEEKQGIIILNRNTPYTKSRKGVIVALDLEYYNYEKGSKSMIRATEATIKDRLPPRIEVRKDALLELPHIMVLIDDPEKTVIEPLFYEKNQFEIAYDFDLMKNSGHIKGFYINSEEKINGFTDALTKLKARSNDGLLYAMGDGNHSLATAKAIWEDMKSKADSLNEIMQHPARFALVEIVNVHDEGIQFEPIHRLIFDIDFDNFMADMKEFFENNDQGFKVSFSDQDANKGNHVINFRSGEKKGNIVISNPKHNLEVGSLETFIEHMKSNKGIKVDYIHGDSALNELSSKKSNIGFFLNSIAKSNLFKTVILQGALPRKAFSMGESEEKRFYIEARKIK